MKGSRLSKESWIVAAGLIAFVVMSPVSLRAQFPATDTQQPTPPGWNDNTQPVPDRNAIFTLRTGVQLVVQDITVTDATGKPVTGLKREDFHIFDDGREQTIKNFEEHAPIDPALAEERQAELASKLPLNTFTNYKAFKSDSVVVFVLDSLDLAVCAQMFLRQYMTEYMKTQPAGTPYIIFQLDTGLQMLQDLTTDRDALRTWVVGKRDQVEFPPQLGPEDPRYPSWPVALQHRRAATVSGSHSRQKEHDLVWMAGKRADDDRPNQNPATADYSFYRSNPPGRPRL